MSRIASCDAVARSITHRISNGTRLAVAIAMRTATFTISLAAAAALALIAEHRDAEACGGCFAPTDTVTTVDSHRMVVSLSPERSILWDQIVYSGNPKDFVWVLPVPSASAQIEIAPSAFFDEIDQLTAPVVQPRPGPAPNGCFGCCSAAVSDSGGVDEADVIVYNEDVVGPYETATIGSTDANALQDWLVQHGYRVVESTVPVIEHYVAQGSVFIALRLAPGEGVQAMQPVRVDYPGYMATFPLKMVAVGASGEVDLSLWVASEQRYEAYNYENAVIDPDDLVFDWDTTTSNYPEAFDDAIASRGGRAWITEYAAPLQNLWFTTEADAEAALIRADLPAPYLTRMRTSMRVDYLTEDLVLAPAEDASGVDRFITAGTELNRPFDDDGGGCQANGNGGANALFITLLIVGANVGWGWRRRRIRG